MTRSNDLYDTYFSFTDFETKSTIFAERLAMKVRFSLDFTTFR